MAKLLPKGTTIPSSGGAALLGFAVQDTNASSTFPTTTNDDDMLAVVGSAYSYVGSGDFVLTAAGCLLTYNGVARRVMIELTASIGVNGGAAQSTMAAGIAHNGDLINVTYPADALSAAGVAYGAANTVASGGGTNVNSQRVITLAPGDTIQPVVGGSTSAADSTVYSLTLRIWDFPP